jgi:5-methylcytosine-specific restriction endonuclease McrA
VPKKLTYTPNSQIRSALRKLFLRSREHSAVLKRDGYSCTRCGAKQSKAKGREVAVEIHHRHGVTNWAALFEAVREHLLCDPAEMETLCKDCHGKEVH